MPLFTTPTIRCTNFRIAAPIAAIFAFPVASRRLRNARTTVAEAAEKLSFDTRTIHRMIAEGELEAVGSEKRLRVRRTSVRAYIKRHRKQ